jgi:hypothetical protein
MAASTPCIIVHSTAEELKMILQDGLRIYEHNIWSVR